MSSAKNDIENIIIPDISHIATASYNQNVVTVNDVFPGYEHVISKTYVDTELSANSGFSFPSIGSSSIPYSTLVDATGEIYVDSFSFELHSYKGYHGGYVKIQIDDKILEYASIPGQTEGQMNISFSTSGELANGVMFPPSFSSNQTYSVEIARQKPIKCNQFKVYVAPIKIKNSTGMLTHDLMIAKAKYYTK